MKVADMKRLLRLLAVPALLVLSWVGYANAQQICPAPVTTLSSLTGAAQLALHVKALNLNATGDTAITFALPPDSTRYVMSAVRASNSTGAVPTTAQIGVYTAASRGGVQINPQQTPPITTQAADTAGNAGALTGILGPTAALTETTLYINVGTAQGAAATCDIIIFISLL